MAPEGRSRSDSSSRGACRLSSLGRRRRRRRCHCRRPLLSCSAPRPKRRPPRRPPRPTATRARETSAARPTGEVGCSDTWRQSERENVVCLIGKPANKTKPDVIAVVLCFRVSSSPCALSFSPALAFLCDFEHGMIGLRVLVAERREDAFCSRRERKKERERETRARLEKTLKRRERQEPPPPARYPRPPTTSTSSPSYPSSSSSSSAAAAAAAASAALSPFSKRTNEKEPTTCFESIAFVSLTFNAHKNPHLKKKKKL